jgi:hypothetical protein
VTANLDIYFASIMIGALAALAARSVVLGPFLLIIDPPSTMERATETFTEIKRRKEQEQWDTSSKT